MWGQERVPNVEPPDGSQNEAMPWKLHSNTAIIFYSSEVCDYVHPTFKGRIWHKQVNTRREGSLRSTLEAASHTPNLLSVLFCPNVDPVGLHHSHSCPLAFCWVWPMGSPHRIKKTIWNISLSALFLPSCCVYGSGWTLLLRGPASLAISFDKYY